MRALARISLLLVLVLIAVSAYLRLHHSGIGCPDFPACYGLIGPPPEPAQSLSGGASQRVVAESNAPLAWAAPLHRLVASLLGLAILALNVMALRARQYRLVCFALLVLTVFLALIGLRSGSLHHPAVVVGNLLGGFTMLGLVGWLVFRIDPGAARYTETRVAPVRANVLVAIVLLAIQIGLGALTSANFAATACEGFPRCNERWYPDATIYQAFRVDEPHEIDDQGYAVGSFERAAIHQAHRLFSVAVLLAIAWTAVSAMFATQASQRLGIAALALVILEMSAGIASVLTGLPTWLAVAHNWLAALLLLVLLKMLAMSREKWWHG